jgi:hypothetical protein
MKTFLLLTILKINVNFKVHIQAGWLLKNTQDHFTQVTSAPYPNILNKTATRTITIMNTII